MTEAEVQTGGRFRMPLVTLKQLLEAGVHFGHQTSRWNPKMKRYIFTARNGIHIIDLQQTVKLLDDASNWVKEVVGGGRLVLFIGTKKQAQESIELEARRSGMPFVNHRWMGGMLTNFTVMRRQIDRLNSLRAIRNNGGFTGSKKAITQLEEEYQRLERFFGGMAEMKRLPGAVYVVDPRKEHIAITEARKLGIPIVAITDSNCDPDEIDHVIPGNDDAIRAVKLITSKIADAALEARQLISPEELTAAPEVPVTEFEFGAEEEDEEEKSFAGMPTVNEAEFYEDEALDDEK
jgi:small subunit ribosomal protein S2